MVFTTIKTIRNDKGNNKNNPNADFFSSLENKGTWKELNAINEILIQSPNLPRHVFPMLTC